MALVPPVAAEKPRRTDPAARNAFGCGVLMTRTSLTYTSSMGAGLVGGSTVTRIRLG